MPGVAFFYLGQGGKTLLRFLQSGPTRLGFAQRLRKTGSMLFALGNLRIDFDHGCGMAITAATGERRPTATLDLRIDYMRPAASRAGVTVEAHCYHMTRSIAFVRAHAWDADPADPIATAQAAFMLAGPIGPGTGGPA